MEDDLIIIPKPDYISWEEITELLHTAFAKRVNQGMRFRAASQDVQTTIEKVGDGICLVALLDNKLVGTITVIYRKVDSKNKKWYHNNSYCYADQLAVHPAYQKKGIAEKLRAERLKICFEKKVDACILDTSIKAKSLVKLHIDSGFQKVELLSSPHTNYYSVRFRLPIYGKEFSKLYVKLRYYYSFIKCRVLKNKYGKYTMVGKILKKGKEYVRRFKTL